MRTPREAVVDWTEQVWNLGRLELVPELLHDPYIRHEPGGETHQFTHQMSHDRVAGARAAIPDVRIELRHIVAEGDFVTAHYVVHGTTAQGPLLQTGMELFRVVEGRFAEVWTTASFDGRW
jgi:predicted SnoaL-like aldol condensation-catalyzing enzyme